MKTKLHELAAALFPGTEFYFVLRSDNPPAEFLSPDAIGCTGRRFDLTIRSWLCERGLWQGRRPAIYLDDQAIREYACGSSESMMLATAVHEFAHVLQYGIDLSEPTPKAESEAIAMTAMAIASYTLYPQAERCGVRWLGHNDRFTRACLHLHYRAWQAGYEIGAGDIGFAGARYGLSPHWRYMRAIGDEPERLKHEAIFEILNTDAPESFVRLWESDTLSKE